MIRASKQDAINAGVYAVPDHIRSQLRGFFDDALLNNVYYRVGVNAVYTLQNMSIELGDAGAVTLDNVIVFETNEGANDLLLWAHELQHVLQYQRMGINEFAEEYIESWNGIEGEAEAVASQFQTYLEQRSTYPQTNSGAPSRGPAPSSGSYVPPVVVSEFPPTQFAAVCMTNWGACPMMVALPTNVSCYCNSVYGQLPGITR